MEIKEVNALAIKVPVTDYFGGAGDKVKPLAGSDIIVQPGWRGIFSTRFQTTMVRIETMDGRVGYGEAHSPVAPDVSAEIVRSILRPILLGRNPMEVGVLWREMYDSMCTRGHVNGFMLDAISGADSALWDIRGKVLDVPIYSLLGGPFRRRIPAYVSGIRGKTMQERLETIRGYKAKGFTAFKYFTGFGIEEDKRTIAEFRNHHPDIVLAADNLWKYNFNEAYTLGRFLDSQAAAWYEAPIDPEDVDGNAELADKLDVPIANGETERTAYQMHRWIAAGAAEIVQPDIGRCGISEGYNICRLAEVYHRPITLHMGICGPALIAASIHVGASSNDVKYMEYQPVCLDVSNTFLKKPIVCEDGHFSLLDGPGLGIELDEDKLRKISTIY